MGNPIKGRPPGRRGGEGWHGWIRQTPRGSKWVGVFSSGFLARSANFFGTPKLTRVQFPQKNSSNDAKRCKNALCQIQKIFCPGVFYLTILLQLENL